MKRPHDLFAGFVSGVAMALPVLGPDKLGAIVTEVGAIIGLIWYLLMIFESKTVQRLLGRPIDGPS